MRREKASNHESLDQEIYQQLKSLARKMMSKERENHTLSATDLVHEAFLKLSVSDMSFNDQKHYFQTFARQMRRVLVNYSHYKNTQKNKGDAVLYTDSLALVDNDFADFNAIDQAINHLEHMDKRSAESVELAYFTNLTQAQIANYLDVSIATLERDLKFGRVIIHEYIDNLK